MSLLETAPSSAPITFVSFRQAAPTAAGSAAPHTRAELEWAITLGGERPYPWGAQDPLSFELDEAPLLLEVMVRSLDGEVRTGLPLRPVTASPSSAEGLVNLVNNVAEWTATERSPVEVVAVSGAVGARQVALRRPVRSPRSGAGRRRRCRYPMRRRRLVMNSDTAGAHGAAAKEAAAGG
ncbi:MAG: hypothetical protein R2755_00140 [Acidimicrobiales bacterium]